MNNHYIINRLTTDNILPFADYLSRLPVTCFMERFQSVADQYQQELKNASYTYRLSLNIQLSNQQMPLSLQRNRYQTLVRKIEHTIKLMVAEELAII